MVSNPGHADLSIQLIDFGSGLIVAEGEDVSIARPMSPNKVSPFSACMSCILITIIVCLLFLPCFCLTNINTRTGDYMARRTPTEPSGGGSLAEGVAAGPQDGLGRRWWGWGRNEWR